MSSPKQTYISVLSFTSVKLTLIQTDLKGEFLFFFLFLLILLLVKMSVVCSGYFLLFLKKKNWGKNDVSITFLLYLRFSCVK